MILEFSWDALCPAEAFSQLTDDERFGVFQGADGSFAPDGREVFEEFVERLATFQVVQQILEGNPRSGKHRCPPGAPRDPSTMIPLLEAIAYQPCTSLLPGAPETNVGSES